MNIKEKQPTYPIGGLFPPLSEFHLFHVTPSTLRSNFVFSASAFLRCTVAFPCMKYQYFSMAGLVRASFFFSFSEVYFSPHLPSSPQWNSSKYELQVSSMAVSVSSRQLERYLRCTQHVCQAIKWEVKSGISPCANTAKGNIFPLKKVNHFLSDGPNTPFGVMAPVSSAFKINVFSLNVLLHLS